MPSPAPQIPSRVAIGDACGEDPTWLCETVYDRTDDGTLAKMSDWFVGTPLTVMCILLGAWVVSFIARRYLSRIIRSVMTHDTSGAARQLGRVGMSGLAAEDPRREARAHSISGVIGSTASVVIWVVAIIAVLGELGIDLAPLIAGAGIAGIALGFGAQSMVKDFLAGIFVLIEDQYGIGDVVDLGEASGSVQEITLRATVLRAQDGTVWHVPNGAVQRVGNKTQLWSVAIVDVTVSYGSDLEHAQAVILQTAKEVCESPAWSDDVLDEPELLGVEAFGTIGVTIRTIVKTTPGNQFAIQRSIREAIKAALDEAGIEIAVQRLQ